MSGRLLVWWMWALAAAIWAIVLFVPAPHEERDQHRRCVFWSVTHGADVPDAVRRCDAWLSWRRS